MQMFALMFDAHVVLQMTAFRCNAQKYTLAMITCDANTA